MPEKEYSVIFSPRFYEDVDGAVGYYKSLQKGLGKEFNQALVKTLKAIRVNPYYQVRYDDVRCLSVGKFPYLIHYSIDEINLEILIEAVICTYRNPGDFYIRG